MTRVIFVHGAYASGDSWFDVPTLATTFEAGDSDSYEPKVIDLPHHDERLFDAQVLADLLRKILSGEVSISNVFDGIESTVTAGSLDEYAEKIASSFPSRSSEKCILVGHSLGGMAISAAAAKYPERIKKLIYVTALLPKDEDSAADLLGETLNSPTVFRDETADLGVQKIMRLLRVLTKQPTGVLNDKFESTTGFEALKKYYIVCTDDGIIPADRVGVTGTQRDMAVGAISEDLPSKHFPQLTQENDLARIIHDMLEDSA